MHRSFILVVVPSFLGSLGNFVWNRSALSLFVRENKKRRQSPRGVMPEYGDKQYWDKRYATCNGAIFDWYNDFPALKPLLVKYLKRQEASVLNVGCGNSAIAESLYDDGYKRVVSIDYSEPAIKAMTERSQTTRPELRYKTMDVTELAFEENEFDFVFDKGTLDSLVCGANVEASVGKMLSEIARVLRPGGFYICMSYGRPQDRTVYLNREEYAWTTTIKTMPKPSLKELQDAAPQRFPISEYDPTVNENSSHFLYIMEKNPLAPTTPKE